MFKLFSLSKPSEYVDNINDIRSAMEKREDYMSMRLPRSFANTVAELFSNSLSNINNELNDKDASCSFQQVKNNRRKKTVSIACR
uniref:hypothetical protein n=1 Tax=Candidatus Electronema sp. TaxID=2698783 RepID=UPI004057C8B3